MKKTITVLLAFCVFTIVFFVIRYSNNNPYQKRIESTQLSLAYLRGGVNHYHDNFGKFPESLTEMKEYLENKEDFAVRKSNLEYISSDQGSDKESVSLNGNGGWFYNKETGELAVNIDKPLKECFSNYFYSNRNKKPSEW